MELLSKWVHPGRTHTTCWAWGRSCSSSRELQGTRWRHLAELEAESGKSEVTEFIGAGLYWSLGFPVRTYIAFSPSQESLYSSSHAFRGFNFLLDIPHPIIRGYPRLLCVPCLDMTPETPAALVSTNPFMVYLSSLERYSREAHVLTWSLPVGVWGRSKACGFVLN